MIRHAIASKRTVFLACLLTSTILLLTPHRVTSKMQLTFQRLFYVPLSLGRSVTLSALPPSGQTDVSPERLQQLRSENQQLKNHLATLQGIIEEQQEDINRLARIRLDSQWQRLAFVPAEIITATGDDLLTINRGRSDALMSNCFVMADDAIIGRIRELTSLQARVMLVSHRDSLLSVYIDSPDIAGTLQGRGRGRLQVCNVPYTKPVKTGRPVYISPHPGFLEIPIIVGRIASCQRDEHDPLLWDIQVEPAADLGQLTRVDVIAVDPS